MTSEVLRKLREKSIPHFANDTIFEHLDSADIDTMKELLEEKFGEVLDILCIDWRNDHNTKETPHRLAKLYVNEVMKGRFQAPPKVTSFPNAKKLDEMYVTGPITVRSMCSHHFVPIMGQCWVGVIPGEKVIGLSKFNRLVDWVMSRPQIQEEAVMQVATLLEKELNPKGLAVVLKATHMCMTWRGVKEPCGEMTNAVMRGVFAQNPIAKKEFYDIIAGQGYKSCNH